MVGGLHIAVGRCLLTPGTTRRVIEQKCNRVVFTVLHFYHEHETLRRTRGRAGQACTTISIGCARVDRGGCSLCAEGGRSASRAWLRSSSAAAARRRCSTPLRARAPPRSCAASASRSRHLRPTGATVAAAGPIGSWEAALTIAASGASAEQPIVLVIDELPFLIESEPAIEAILQKQWDRRLEAQPVLLLLIGSDVSMMAALNDYGRPLYGRLTEMTIGPLSPAAIGDMLGLPARSGARCLPGDRRLPAACRRSGVGERISGSSCAVSFENPESPLIVLGERSLGAEFPAELKARDALEAIGAGERTFTTILQRATDVEQDAGDDTRDADRQACDRQVAALLRPATSQALTLLRLRSLPALLASLHPREHPGARAWPRRPRLPTHPRIAGHRSPATRSSR